MTKKRNIDQYWSKTDQERGIWEIEYDKQNNLLKMQLVAAVVEEEEEQNNAQIQKGSVGYICTQVEDDCGSESLCCGKAKSGDTIMYTVCNTKTLMRYNYFEFACLSATLTLKQISGTVTTLLVLTLLY